MAPTTVSPSAGAYRRREGVRLEGTVLSSRRPLAVTRLNDAASDVVAALDGDEFRSPEHVAEAVGMEAAAVRSLFEGLHDRGFLAWRPSLDPEYRPPVSVVVTTLDAADELEGCLDALAALDYPDYEVILVDGGSTDGTVELARAHSLATDGTLRVLEAGWEGAGLSIGAGRNRGVLATSGEVVAFTDADCRPRESWLSALVPCLAAHDVVGGRVRPAGGSSVDCYEGYNSSLDMGPRSARVTPDGDTPYLPTANLLVRRSVFDTLGFPDRNVAEDVAFCWQALEAGFDVAYHPAGVVDHEFRYGLRAFAGRRTDYGCSEALLEREFGASGSVAIPAVPLLGTFLLVLAFLAGLAGWGSSAPVWLGLTGLVAVGGLPLFETLVRMRRLAGTATAGTVVRSSGRSVLSTWYAGSREVARYYTLPAVLLGLLATGFGVTTGAQVGGVIGVALLVGALSVAVGPVAVELLVYRPEYPVRYCFWALLDTVGYQTGVYRGLVVHRTLAHLLPWRRFRLAGPGPG